MSIVSKIKKGMFISSINIYSLFNKSKFKKSVAIVSSKEYKGKLYEDLYLKKKLLKENINVEIVAYEDDIDYKRYDLVLIRSIWGYQNNLDLFKKFLDSLKDINVYNSIDLINNNYDKKKQYDYLIKNNISCIDTKFIYEYNDSIFDNISSVVKPIISASGNNTFILSKEVDKDKIKGLFKDNNGIMMQPFIKSINEGEYSVIYFDNKLSHVIKRYPGILTSKKGVEHVKDVDNKLLTLANDVSNIYKEALYLRIDIIKNNNEYKVLETEVLDPSFFLHAIKDKIVREEKLKILVDGIKKRI